MTTIGKRSSGKATIECRYNSKQKRWRCHVAVGKRRIGPVFVRVPGDLGDDPEAGDEAARLALVRAVEKGTVDLGEIEHDDGGPVIHGEREGAKRSTRVRGRASARRPGPATAKKRGPRAAARAKRAAPANAGGRANRKRGTDLPREAVKLPNGDETRALEREYKKTKRDYHVIGDALKERHEAEAALQAGG